MKRIRIRAPRALALVAAVTAVVLTASACGSSEPRDVLADAAEGQLTIGTKYDQPVWPCANPTRP